MPFRFKQPDVKKPKPEDIDSEKLSKPTRHTLQRANQRWKQSAKPMHRNLLEAEPIKEENKGREMSKMDWIEYFQWRAGQALRAGDLPEAGRFLRKARALSQLSE